MWWWQSQAPAGALSLAGSLPEEFGTCWARLTPTKMRGAADAIATIEAFLMNVRRAIMFPSRLVCLEYNLRVVLCRMSCSRSGSKRVRRRSWAARKRFIPSTARSSWATCLPRSVNGTAVVGVLVFLASRTAVDSSLKALQSLVSQNSIPWQRRGGRDHEVNGPVPFTGADGVVRSTSNNRWLERTTPKV